MSKENRVSTLLGCTHPIVLAGMGGPSRSDLVGAVTAAGGFGFLGMVREPPMLIVREVEKLREAGHNRFGVNIIPAATEPGLLDMQLETIIALGVPVVGLFWDIDEAVIARLREADILVVHQVGSVEEAAAAERAGVQIVIAQGREAGGHVRGTMPLRTLLPATVAAVGVPVLAAGGLATGGDMLTAMALGAEGAVFGTAFLATEESFAHPYHKERLLAAEPSDTLLTGMFHINWPPGAPVRVLSSAVTSGARGGTNTVIGEEEGRPIYLFSTDSPLRSMTGDFESMALYAGTGVGSVTAIRPAAEVVCEIAADAAASPARVDIVTEVSSPACYAHEMGGTYMGELEPEEIAAEIAALLSDLKALLAAILAETAVQCPGEGPPFSKEAEPLARWIVHLTPGAADLAVAAGPLDGAPEARRAVVKRLGTLIPRVPGRTLGAELTALRAMVEISDPRETEDPAFV